MADVEGPMADVKGPVPWRTSKEENLSPSGLGQPEPNRHRSDRQFDPPVTESKNAVSSIVIGALVGGPPPVTKIVLWGRA